MMSSILVKQIIVTNKSFINYTYLIFDEMSKCGVLVDPSWQKEVIMEQVEEFKLKIVGILLTHGHQDHVNLADYFGVFFGAPIYIHEAELQDFRLQFGDCKLIREDVWLNIGTLRFYIYHTPGHTRGSCCFSIHSFLFTGDTLFIEGCGIAGPYQSSCTQLYFSIQKLKQVTRSTYLIYPGHSFSTVRSASFDYILKNNIYLQIGDEDTFVKFRSRPDQKGLFSFV
jgi:hydroxyacylglutathione hydrolase